MPVRSKYRPVMLLLATALACGGGPDADSVASPPTVIELRTVGSRTAFMPDSLVADAGATVILRFTNDGEVVHNAVFVRNPESVEPIVLAAYRAIATEYVPEGFEADILVATPLVYPGETFEVSFEMPAIGRYTYVCVFPTHGASMRGTLISR
jgi:plastocyanin